MSLDVTLFSPVQLNHSLFLHLQKGGIGRKEASRLLQVGCVRARNYAGPFNIVHLLIILMMNL